MDDIAEGTIKALKNVGYEIINLGGGNEPSSLKYVISLIEKFLDKKAKIEYKPFHIADMKASWADISKANKLLGWQPRIGIEDGLKMTVEWHVKNRDWLKQVQL